MQKREGAKRKNTVRTAQRPEHAILGQILKSLREAAQLTQRQVAYELGRTHAFVWKVESGTQHVDIPTLLDLTDLYGADVTAVISQVRVLLTSYVPPPDNE